MNTRIKKIAAMVIVASLTSGCAMYRLEELRNTTPSGSPFQQELARLYMDLATQDEKGYDWFNSWYFADKGLRAAYGKDVMPEDLADWNIPESELPSLQEAHGRLLVALTPENEQSYPQAAAEAQVYFDCWVQRQNEEWQTDRIEYCHEGFAHALSQLPISTGAPKEIVPEHKHKHKKPKKAAHIDAEGNNVEPVDHSAEEKPKAAEEETPKAAASKKAEGAETLSYVVFFAGERPVISDPGEQVLDDVIKSLKGAESYEVVLKSGAGSDSSSKLFSERVEAITKRLVEGGVKPDSILTGNAKGAAAKHIEIFISQ